MISKKLKKHKTIICVSVKDTVISFQASEWYHYRAMEAEMGYKKIERIHKVNTILLWAFGALSFALYIVRGLLYPPNQNVAYTNIRMQESFAFDMQVLFVLGMVALAIATIFFIQSSRAIAIERVLKEGLLKTPEKRLAVEAVLQKCRPFYKRTFMEFMVLLGVGLVSVLTFVS